MGPDVAVVFLSTCILSHFSHVWPFVTPWTMAHHAPLSMGFSRQEYWSALPCPSPGDLRYLGTEPASPSAPALQGDSLLLSHQGSPVIFLVPHFTHLPKPAESLKADICSQSWPTVGRDRGEKRVVITHKDHRISELVWSIHLIPIVWSIDQQHKHNLGASWKSGTSGSTPDLLTLDLPLYDIPRWFVSIWNFYKDTYIHLFLFIYILAMPLSMWDLSAMEVWTA